MAPKTNPKKDMKAMKAMKARNRKWRRGDRPRAYGKVADATGLTIPVVKRVIDTYFNCAASQLKKTGYFRLGHFITLTRKEVVQPYPLKAKPTKLFKGMAG